MKIRNGVSDRRFGIEDFEIEVIKRSETGFEELANKLPIKVNS